MRLYSPRRFIPALLVSVALAGCSDDGGTAPDIPISIQGSWIATSMLTGGQDLIADGMGLSFFFTADGEYSYLVTNDLAGFCDSGTTCEDFGDFTATSSTITFDPREDPAVFNYTLIDGVMTLSGTLDGFPIVATLERH